MQQERKARDGPGGRRKGAATTSLTSAIFMGRAKRGEEGDVSQHSQSYKFQEPSMLYLGMAGNLRRDGKGGRIKVAYSARGRVVYHHDHCNVALVFASGSAGTDCRDERASREEGLQSGRLTGQQNFFPAPFGCLLVCSSAPPPLFWSFLAWGWDSLSLGRGNLICSLLPPVPSRSPSSLPLWGGVCALQGKEGKKE